MQRLDSRLGFLPLGHLDERKASRAACHAVGGNPGAAHSAVATKEFFQIKLAGTKRDITDKDAHISAPFSWLVHRWRWCTISATFQPPEQAPSAHAFGGHSSPCFCATGARASCGSLR